MYIQHKCVCMCIYIYICCELDWKIPNEADSEYLMSRPWFFIVQSSDMCAT